MGQLATAIHTAAQQIPAAPAVDANLLTGPQLAVIFAQVEAAVAALELRAAGSQFLSNTGPPSNTIGNNSDLYLNTANGDLWGKDAAAWELLLNVRGPVGLAGQRGATGQQGETGPRGSNGAAGRNGLDGTDGRDGADGATVYDETYAPDDATGRDGDEWYHSKSLTAYDRYYKIAGRWRLRFSGSGAVVTPPANAAPVIVFNAPAAGATVTVGQALTLTATATDDVSVSTVEFLNGATGASLGMGAKNGSTYTLSYTPTAPGALSLVARATDGAGLSSTATVSVTVAAGTVPVPTISGASPNNGAVGATTTLTGTNFATPTAFALNGTPITVYTLNSATSITFTVPAGASTGVISLTTPGGTATSTGSFTVTVTAGADPVGIVTDDTSNFIYITPAAGTTAADYGIEATA